MRCGAGCPGSLRHEGRGLGGARRLRDRGKRVLPGLNVDTLRELSTHMQKVHASEKEREKRGGSGTGSEKECGFARKLAQCFPFAPGDSPLWSPSRPAILHTLWGALGALSGHFSTVGAG